MFDRPPVRLARVSRLRADDRYAQGTTSGRFRKRCGGWASLQPTPAKPSRPAATNANLEGPCREGTDALPGAAGA